MPHEGCAESLMDVNKANNPLPRGPVMYPQQIKDEIRKLNWVDRIGLYRWINEEIAGRPWIGTNRSLQIREEIERMCNAAHPKTHFIERRKRESIENAESQQRNDAPSS